MSSYNDRKIARERRAKAYKFLIDKGMEPYKAAGVVGNLMQESYNYLDSEVVNNIGAVGIAQWLGPRKDNLKDFAKQRGTSYKDFDTQLEFLYEELSTTYRGNKGGWSKRQKAAFDNAKTVEEASDMFVLHFERPGKHERHMDKRRKYSTQVFLENNDPNIYAKDKKGEIVNLNPEEATPRQIEESDFVKHEFYDQQFYKLREEEIKKSKRLSDEVQRARATLIEQTQEANFLNQIQGGSNSSENIEEVEEVEGAPAVESSAKELESQIFGNQSTQSQLPVRGSSAHLYPDLRIPENEFYNLLMPEGFKYGGKVKKGVGIRQYLNGGEDEGDPIKKPVNTAVDNTFVATLPVIDRETFEKAQMQRMTTGAPVSNPYDLSRIQDPEKVSDEQVESMMKAMRGFSRTITPLEVDQDTGTPDLSQYGFNTGRDLKAEEFGAQDPLLKQGVGKDKNLTAKKNVSSYIEDTLRQGDRGDQVKLLQIYLVSNGYLNEDVKEVDGIFGKKTAAAVKQYQQDNNLKIDAVVGKNTKQAMSGINPVSGNLKNVLDEKPTTKKESFKAAGNIKGFQKVLTNELKIDTKGMSGEWDENTQEAFEQFKEYVYSDTQSKFKPAIFKSIGAAQGERGSNLTEKNFGEAELELMRRMAVKDGKIQDAFDYKDIREGSTLEGTSVTEYLKHPIESLKNMPAINLSLVLGQASFIVAPDGNLYVFDTYDMNDVGDFETDRRTPDEVYNDRIAYAESQGDMKYPMSVYSAKRAEASRAQRREQIMAHLRGEAWRPTASLINLGNAEEILKKYGS